MFFYLPHRWGKLLLGKITGFVQYILFRPGKQGNATPVANFRDLVQLVLLLPGKAAASFRVKAANYLCRLLSGDMSLIPEIVRTNQSVSPELRDAVLQGVSSGPQEVDRRRKLYNPVVVTRLEDLALRLHRTACDETNVISDVKIVTQVLNGVITESKTRFRQLERDMKSKINDLHNLVVSYKACLDKDYKEKRAELEELFEEKQARDELRLKKERLEEGQRFTAKQLQLNVRKRKFEEMLEQNKLLEEKDVLPTRNKKPFGRETTVKAILDQIGIKKCATTSLREIDELLCSAFLRSNPAADLPSVVNGERIFFECDKPLVVRVCKRFFFPSA
jgi:hypothetical protein